MSSSAFPLTSALGSWLLLEQDVGLDFWLTLVGFCFASFFVSVIKKTVFFLSLYYLWSILISGNYKNFSI